MSSKRSPTPDCVALEAASQATIDPKAPLGGQSSSPRPPTPTTPISKPQESPSCNNPITPRLIEDDMAPKKSPPRAAATPCVACQQANATCEIEMRQPGCTNCVSNKAQCSLFSKTEPICEACISGHHKCMTEKGSTSGCTLCVARGVVCKPGPTDAAKKEAMRKSGTKKMTKEAGDEDEGGGDPDYKSPFAVGPSTAASSRGRRERGGDMSANFSSPLAHRLAAYDSDGTLPAPRTPAPKRGWVPPADYVPVALPMKKAQPPPEPVNKPALEREIALGLEEWYQQWEPFDPTNPTAGHSTLPKLMCCNEAKPVDVGRDGAKVTDGTNILVDLFNQYRNCYSVEVVKATCPEDWGFHDTYIGITVEGGETRVYAVLDHNLGNLAQFLPTTERPEIGGVVLAKDTAKERLYRVDGGVEFLCEAHGKKYITYFLRYIGKDKEWNMEWDNGEDA